MRSRRAGLLGGPFPSFSLRVNNRAGSRRFQQAGPSNSASCAPGLPALGGAVTVQETPLSQLCEQASGMMGRAEIQMLQGIWVGDGGARGARTEPAPHPHAYTHPGNRPGPPVAPRKSSPRHAGGRDRVQERRGERSCSRGLPPWTPQAVGDRDPPGLPRCFGLRPALAAGKVARSADRPGQGPQ